MAAKLGWTTQSHRRPILPPLESTWANLPTLMKDIGGRQEIMGIITVATEGVAGTGLHHRTSQEDGDMIGPGHAHTHQDVINLMYKTPSAPNVRSV